MLSLHRYLYLLLFELFLLLLLRVFFYLILRFAFIIRLHMHFCMHSKWKLFCKKKLHLNFGLTMSLKNYCNYSHFNMNRSDSIRLYTNPIYETVCILLFYLHKCSFFCRFRGWKLFLLRFVFFVKMIRLEFSFETLSLFGCETISVCTNRALCTMFTNKCSKYGYADTPNKLRSTTPLRSDCQKNLAFPLRVCNIAWKLQMVDYSV